MRKQWLMGVLVILIGVATGVLVVIGGEPTQRYLRGMDNQRTIEDEVGSRLCYAGRFRVESRTEDRATGRFVELVASNPDHDNAIVELSDYPPEAVPLVEFPTNVEFKVGATYCLIITRGSKVGMTIVAWGEDSPAALAEIKKIMQSPNAYKNDARTIKRNRLWKRFFQHFDPKRAHHLTVYCEDDELDTIFFALEENGKTDLCWYFDKQGVVRRIESHGQIGLPPGPFNRLTYDHGDWIVWHCGRPVVKFDGGTEVDPWVKN